MEHQIKGLQYFTGEMSSTIAAGWLDPLRLFRGAVHKAGMKRTWCRVRLVGWRIATLITELAGGTA
jgi:hypothetical protein